MFFLPQPAAELTGHAGCLHDGADTGPIDRLALAGAIEIDEMQIGRALGHPAPRHGGGVVAEDGFLSVVALAKTHALAAAQVDGREDEHGAALPCKDRERLTAFCWPL